MLIYLFENTRTHAHAQVALLGKHYRRAAAFLDPRFLELGKPDTSHVSLRFASGALGVIENRLRSGYGYETLLEVGGSLAKGVVRDDAVDALTLYREARLGRVRKVRPPAR